LEIAAATYVPTLLVLFADAEEHHIGSLDRIAHCIYSTACITNDGRKVERLQFWDWTQQKQYCSLAHLSYSSSQTT
jgi:hypothetical protein